MLFDHQEYHLPVAFLYIYNQSMNMDTVLKYGTKRGEIKRLHDLVDQETDRKGIDAYKYCGFISICKSPVNIQSKLRKEVERRLSLTLIYFNNFV